jgi:hypothetical protein
MKRVFLGLLLFVMLFIVSACTGKDTDRETGERDCCIVLVSIGRGRTHIRTSR